MSKKLVTKGPMDRYIKPIKKTDNQQGESSESPHLQRDAKEEEAHENHSFTWKCNLKKLKLITCTQAGTVENSLQKCRKFQKGAKQNKEKELVIVILKDGTAISNHFPCCLIESDAVLTIKYIKAAGKPKQSAALPQSKMLRDKLVTFKVATTGGKRIVRIMRNMELKADGELSVYGCKEETVKQALKRDGRFNNMIFKKHCELSEKSTERSIGMNNVVDDLDGKTFQVIYVDDSSQSESQPGSLEDAYMEPNEPHTSSSDVNQDPPQQSTASESVNTCTPGKKPMLIPVKSFSEIPNSENVLNLLREQFKDLVQHMKTREKVSKLSDVKNLFRVEYGKNIQTCLEVKMVKKLMDLSNSVCQVRLNGRPEGSGFLLFDRFVLTNGHVVRNICVQKLGQHQVTVTFSFESLDQDSCATLQVKDVVVSELFEDASGKWHDWALLELLPADRLSDGLLKCFGFVPPSGGICIIGHPESGVKKIDPCFIIPVEQNYVENKECLHLVTNTFFVGNRQNVHYNTCFYDGSSGSPVFDEHCNVVAMHTGGYNHTNKKGQTPTVIEFAQPLSLIIERIIPQIVESGRFDVLKEYLTCEHANRKEVMENVKKIVDSRNLTAFTKVPDNCEFANQDVKDFFHLFSQEEAAIPMDTE